MARPVRIALLFPVTGLIDGELCRMAERRGAEALIFRVTGGAVARADDPDDVGRMVRDMGAPENLARVARTARAVAPDVVVWACTSGSFLGGADTLGRQADAMAEAAGVPATTTSLAVLDALREHAIRRPAVVTPYHEPIGHAFAAFLTRNGFDVAGEAHAGCGSDAEVDRLRFNDIAPLAIRAGVAHADALVVPCTAMHSDPLHTELERQFGRQVILANPTTFDAALKIARRQPTQSTLPPA